MTTDKIMALADDYATAFGVFSETRIERRETLRTEIEKLVRENEAAHAVGIRQEQQIMDLEAESSALVRDAERWRTFLGTRPANTHDVICEAIDAAMEKQS